MGLFLFICFVLMEAILMISSFTKYQEKKQWLFVRWALRAGELAIFLFVMLLPNVTFDFKYIFCFFTLLIRLARALGMYLIKRNTVTGKRSKAGAVFGGTCSILILAVTLIPAFVFTEYNGLNPSGEYKVKEASSILIDKSRTESFETDGSNREIPLHFYYPETEENKSDLFPLVIFSHGAFGFYESNFSTYMELASNGYVVISLEHPYHSLFTKDTDGKLITADPAFLQNMMYINEDGTPEEELFQLSHEWVKLRVADMDCVLDSVEKAKQNGCASQIWFVENETDRKVIENILTMTDTEKTALMGHSLGGAASVTAGREREDVDAVIDLDGTMIGEQISYKNGKYQYIKEPYPVPVFSLDNEEHYFGGQEYGVLYVNNYIIRNARDSRHEYISGAAHMNYTDLPLFAPFLASKLGTGSIDATECIETMNGMILEFLNCYLKGEQAAWK